jgi:outer membrane protein assembly factor BamB
MNNFAGLFCHGCIKALPVWIFCLVALASQGASFDWYRWRGPDLNGISKETGWSTQWPKEGPKVLWKASVGIGFSSITVANGRAYTLGNRSDKDTVYAFDAETGRELWKFTYNEDTDPHYYEGGTSCTPTVDGDAVYSISRRGELFRFEAATGKVTWQINIAKQTGAKVPEWGFASSPVVEGDLLILNAGAAGTAVNKHTGKVVWTSGPASAGYSSAVPFNYDNERYVVLAVLESIVAVRIRDGSKLWEYPWKTRYDVNAADPILVGNKVFISSAYNHGCALFEFKGKETAKLWENKNMRNHFNACVLIDGHLYGVDGDAGAKEASLRCLDLETGSVKWTEKSVGSGALMAADGKLIILGDKGELIIAEPSPSEFKPIARAQVIGGKCWTVPVLANGRIYCRSAQGSLVCVDVRGRTGADASGTSDTSGR